MAPNAKPKIPWEIRNAREWDPSRIMPGNRFAQLDDSDDSDEGDDYLGPEDQGLSSRSSKTQTNLSFDKGTTVNQTQSQPPTTSTHILQHSTDQSTLSHGPSRADTFTLVQRNKPVPRGGQPHQVRGRGGKLGPAVRVAPNAQSGSRNEPVGALTAISTGEVSRQLQGVLTSAQNVQISRQQQPQAVLHRRPKGAPRFERDTTGRAMFRKNLPPTDVLKLSYPIVAIIPDMVRLRECFQGLESRFKTFIRFPQSSTEKSFAIWGLPAKVASTIMELKLWIKEAEARPIPSSRAKEKFGKITSVMGFEYQQEEERQMKQAQLQLFQKDPEPGRLYSFSGAYLWPSDEFQPQAVFGRQLEAFDPLRYQFKCHITLDQKSQAIRLHTDKQKSITRLLERIQGVLKALQAQAQTNHGSRSLKVYAVEPPVNQSFETEIKLHASRMADGTPCFVPVFVREPLSSNTQKQWMLERSKLVNRNTSLIVRNLSSILPILIWFRGNVKIRLHFGTYALTDFRRPDDSSDYTFDNLMETFMDPGTSGNLITE